MDDEARCRCASAPSAVDAVGVGVAAEPVVGLVEGHVGGARGDVGGGQPGDAGADDRDPAARGSVVMRLARSRLRTVKRATGSEVGTVDPPAGSTVMPRADGVRDVAR